MYYAKKDTGSTATSNSTAGVAPPAPEAEIAESDVIEMALFLGIDPKRVSLA